jgi:hypothetical protein
MHPPFQQRVPVPVLQIRRILTMQLPVPAPVPQIRRILTMQGQVLQQEPRSRQNPWQAQR